MSGLVRCSLRFHTDNPCPATSNRSAIGVPVLPSMKYGIRRVLTAAHIAELTAAVGTDGLITGESQLQTYECDGLTNFRVIPGAVVLPRTRRQVQAVVRILCSQHEFPLSAAALAPASVAERFLPPAASSSAWRA